MLIKKLCGYSISEPWMSTRAVMCVMMFTACWMSYICRLQMPILAVPMIAHRANESTTGVCDVSQRSSSTSSISSDRSATKDIPAALISQDELILREIENDSSERRYRRQDNADQKDEVVKKRGITDLTSGTPFNWTAETRGHLLAAYALGNIPGNLMGGLMAIKFGPRRTILWTSLFSALISLASPLIANVSWIALLVSRVFIGLFGGVIFPACHSMVARWAPPDEKSRFVWSLQGGAFGTIFTYPLIAYLADHLSWEVGWYVPALIMLIWVMCWAYLAYDSPSDHPRISEQERSYILTAQGGTVSSKAPGIGETPILAILTSIPFLCLVACHFGNLFLLFFYQNSMMLYLTKALGFKLAKGGILASLPWFARIAFGFFFSWAGDIVKRRELISLTAFRKCATIFSHFIPGIFLVLVGYAGCNFELANVFLFFALGFNGAACISNLSNNQDLSPNYAGFLYGIMNTFGTSTGMIIPPMVEEIAGKHGNPIDRWQIVFWIGASVCILSMVIFIIGGSAKVQSWNEPKQTTAKA